MMVTTRTTLFAILIAMALPSVAAAKSPGGLPSGNSGAYQYVESIPTAGGAKRDGPVHSAPKSSSPGSVPVSTQRSLQGDGSAGQAAFSVAAATAPKARHRPRRRANSQAHPASGTAPPGSSGGPPSGASRASAVIGAVTGVGANGSGVALLIILIAVAAGAVALRLRRRAVS
jgi:hypothetical protein